MSEQNSDPMLLFTPPRRALDLSGSGRDNPTFPKPISSRAFHIAVPSLPRSTKKKYMALPDSSLTNDVPFEPEDLDQVIGEYRQKGTLYYFARFRDGTTHKVRVFYSNGIL
jgi:hypothetical protein